MNNFVSLCDLYNLRERPVPPVNRGNISESSVVLSFFTTDIKCKHITNEQTFNDRVFAGSMSNREYYCCTSFIRPTSECRLYSFDLNCKSIWDL